VKLAVGLFAGSSVLLAEAAHSLADTLNQLARDGRSGVRRVSARRAWLLLRHVTGSQVWDGAAAIAVGVPLIAVAIRLGAENRERTAAGLKS
jgi:hypothetical protein